MPGEKSAIRPVVSQSRSVLPLVGSGRFWLLAPDLSTSIPDFASKDGAFFNQGAQLDSLESRVLTGQLRLHIARLRQQQLAVTQEAMLAHHIPLGVCPV